MAYGISVGHKSSGASLIVTPTANGGFVTSEGTFLAQALEGLVQQQQEDQTQKIPEQQQQHLDQYDDQIKLSSIGLRKTTQRKDLQINERGTPA